MSEIETRLGAGRIGDWSEIRESLLETAQERALIDLAWEGHDSPFGTLLVFASDSGIVRIALSSEEESEVIADLASRVSPRMARFGRADITEARRQLDRYFAGDLKSFELPLDWQLTKGFRRDVLHVAEAIPYGGTVSYTDLAVRVGNPKAVRAAGSAMATNPLPIVIPCHRVLRSDGAVGSYLGGTPMKEALLAMEQEVSGR